MRTWFIKVNRVIESVIGLAIFCWSSYALFQAVAYEAVHQITRTGGKSHVITYAESPGFFIFYVLLWLLFWVVSAGALYFRLGRKRPSE